VCGLAGVWRYDGDRDETLTADVERMAETLRHRGPDDGGVHVDGAAGLAFGFRRLAVIDLSPAGHQPMISADGRFAIAFNGEIYTYQAVAAELRARGTVFRGTSDTEVLLEAASCWGVDGMLPRIGGMFAFALWDRQERVLYLGRDRLGKKPLYVATLPGLLLFGSELKALCAHPAFVRRLDRTALAAYVQFGYVPGAHAIYESVQKVEPGCCLVVRSGGRSSVDRYWHAGDVARRGLEEPLDLDDTAAADALDERLRRAVSRRMVADVPLGAFLSGGIDSSMVVSAMQAQSSRPVRTFTIGFEAGGFDEAQAAKAVAAHLGTDHTELYVTHQEARGVIPLLPDLYDEPFADSSQIPTFLVAGLARRHVTVALSGDGGDEVFGGYTRYLWAESIWRHLRPWPPAARRVAARTIAGVPPAWIDAVYRAVEPIVAGQWRQSHLGDKLQKLAAVIPAIGPDAIYARLVSQWKDPHAIVTGAGALDAFPPTLVADAGSRLGFTDRMMLADLVSYLPGDILVKVDRASMGVSLEARAPLLDHDLVEWAWRLPFHQKRRQGTGKWLLRRVLARYVPDGLIERPKMGFGVPIGDWLRGPLRDWADDLLGAERLGRQQLFEVAPIRSAWDGHLAGTRCDEARLWVILMFQAWLDRWRPIF
jgi:asparagine synthase (glutamine-hydrolysing)